MMHLHTLAAALFMICDGFLVKGPSGPLVVALGSSVVLPCYVDEQLPLKGLKVIWIRTDINTLVHVFQDYVSQPDAQYQDYRDRAHFFTDQIKHGNFSLRLENVRAEDKGFYRCKVYTEHESDETWVQIKAVATSTDNNQGEDIPGNPCNNGTIKAFSEVLHCKTVLHCSTLYSIVFIVGFIGNGLVVCVLIRYRQKSNMTDVCFFNLALADLLVLVSLPFLAHGAIDEWIFGKFMCHTIAGFFMIGLYGSIFFMVLLTLYRYVAIAHVFFYKKRFAKMGLILASIVWMLSLFASLPNIIFAREKNESNKTSCGTDFPEGTAWMSFTYLQMNLLSLIIPLIIMSFCYCRIIPTLLSIKSQKRHIRLILAVLAVYFLFWTPYNIVMFLMFLQSKGYLLSCDWHSNLSLAMQWVETIALSHCCLNPIIYAFARQRYRRAVLKVLKDTFPFCFSH